MGDMDHASNVELMHRYQCAQFSYEGKYTKILIKKSFSCKLIRFPLSWGLGKDGRAHTLRTIPEGECEEEGLTEQAKAVLTGFQSSRS